MSKTDSRHRQLRESGVNASTGGSVGDVSWWAKHVVSLIDELTATQDERSAASDQVFLKRHALLAIHDLASARLRNPPLEPNVESDLTQIVSICDRELASPAQGGEGPVKP